jgi:hypothetical protein
MIIASDIHDKAGNALLVDNLLSPPSSLISGRETVSHMLSRRVRQSSLL